MGGSRRPAAGPAPGPGPPAPHASPGPLHAEIEGGGGGGSEGTCVSDLAVTVTLCYRGPAGGGGVEGHKFGKNKATVFATF